VLSPVDPGYVTLMTPRRIALVLAATLTGCASEPPAATTAAVPISRPAGSVAPHPIGAKPPQPATASSASGGAVNAGRPLPQPAPQLAKVELAELTQVVREAVVSLGIDTQKGRAAALGKGVTQTWMDAGDGWKAMPIPAALTAAAGERDRARIYFGRDNQPRIMGTRLGAAGPRQLYLRFRHGAWKAWPRELASFAGKPHAALYGVLGWDDPEVLCKVGAFCLIKQRRGWSEVPLPLPAPAVAVRVDLGADGAYALLEHKLLRLRDKSWQPVGGVGNWKGRPAAAWIRGDDAWVSVPGDNALHRLAGAGWQRHPSPVRAPRGLWSHAAGRLWVVGEDGAAYFDSKRWHRIAGLGGPLTDVVGHQDRIWFAGDSGVWQALLPK
jgi:hypothetical protein